MNLSMLCFYVYRFQSTSYFPSYFFFAPLVEEMCCLISMHLCIFNFLFHNWFLVLLYSWLLNGAGVWGANPHAVESPHITLQLALHARGSTSVDSTNCGLWSTVVCSYWKKKYTCKWNLCSSFQCWKRVNLFFSQRLCFVWFWPF